MLHVNHRQNDLKPQELCYFVNFVALSQFCRNGPETLKPLENLRDRSSSHAFPQKCEYPGTSWHAPRTRMKSCKIISKNLGSSEELWWRAVNWWSSVHCVWRSNGVRIACTHPAAKVGQRLPEGQTWINLEYLRIIFRLPYPIPKQFCHSQVTQYETHFAYFGIHSAGCMLPPPHSFLIIFELPRSSICQNNPSN